MFLNLSFWACQLESGNLSSHTAGIPIFSSAPNMIKIIVELTSISFKTLANSSNIPTPEALSFTLGDFFYRVNVSSNQYDFII